MIKQLKEIFTNSKAITFYWQFANGLVILILSGLEGIDLINAKPEEKITIAVAISLFINLSKWINKKYLKFTN